VQNERFFLARESYRKLEKGIFFARILGKKKSASLEAKEEGVPL